MKQRSIGKQPRIGIFAHSTNPRGGVVHALQLAEALAARGVDATLLAPAPAGSRFFRAPSCRSVLIPAAPAQTLGAIGVEALVETRRCEIAGFLRAPDAPRFDILHAQDSISALALSDLADDGRIPGFLRTVHHFDTFSSPRLAFWQDEAVRQASGLFCVSRMWQSELARRFGREATLVGNGVDPQRFTPRRDGRDDVLRGRLLPDGGRVILALGGIETRKNTLGVLRGFIDLIERPGHDDVRLLIAGGASLLDHAEAHRDFRATLDRCAHAHRVLLAGIIDDAELPSLYRAATMLCCASLREGFGLCVLEAMASGIPVIAPRGAPFDEYLSQGDAIRVDPASPGGIADAMQAGLHPRAIRLAAMHGPARARRFDWDAVARAHLCKYARLCSEPSLHA